MNKFLYTTILVFTTSLISLMPLKAQAQVFINGELIQGQELQNLQMLLDNQIPSGRYWLDSDTGNWGYEGNSQVQGNLYVPIDRNSNSYDNPNGGNSGGAGSYYSSGGAGGYGSYASDGECSYFSSGGMTFNTCDNW
ncbi:MAG: hypothetical protein WBM44_05175 [Waterburya sp.]